MKKVLIVLALACLGSGLLADAGVRIEPGGAEVVVAPGSGKVVGFAAQEMATFLGESLGAAVPVVETPTDGKAHLFLGEGRYAAAKGIETAGLERDAFRIVVGDGAAYIVGRDDRKADPERAFKGLRWAHDYERATLFGVYEFLERYAGVRFYFPGELGTVVPRHTSLEVPAADFTVAPAFKSRRHSFMHEGSWFEGEKRDVDSTMRSRWLNAYRLREETAYVPFGHGLVNKGYVQRFGKTHPEYFLLQEDGTRRTSPDVHYPCHLCLTSGIWDEVYRDVRSYLKGEDASVRGVLNRATGKVGWGIDFQVRKYVDIMPQDCMPRCACAACTAAYDTDDPNDFADTILWTKTAEVGRRLLAEGIGGYVTQMSYVPYARVPNVDLPSNVLVQVAVTGPWAVRDENRYARDLATVRAWAEKTGGKVSLWTYALMFRETEIPDVPKFAPRAWGRFYKDVSPFIYGVFAETACDRFLYDQLNYYVFSKVAWNPAVDVEALLDEYYRLMFGPAAEDMRKFGDLLERKWTGEVLKESRMDQGGPGNTVVGEKELWEVVYGPQVLAELKGLIASAAGRTKPGTLERRRVRLVSDEMLKPLFAAAERYRGRRDGRFAEQRYALGSAEPMRLTPFAIQKLPAAVGGPETTVKAWEEDGFLKVRIVCSEPRMDKRRATAYEVKNYRLFGEDCVEIMINPSGDRDEVYHFGINSAGAFADGLYHAKTKEHGKGSDYRSNAKVKVERTDDSWTAECAIPLASLPGLGDEFPAEVTRHRVIKITHYTQPEFYHWGRYAKGPLDVGSFGLWSRTGRSSAPIRVGAVNCGAFRYGTKTVTEGEYAAGWDGLAREKPADVFFYEDIGSRVYPEKAFGAKGLDIRAAVADGKGEVSVVELPRTIEVEGEIRKTPRYRALRVVRDWNGGKVAFYGVHLVAEGHIRGPKPPKGEMSFSQRLRREQFKALIADAKSFDHAVIAGDFNAQKPSEYDVFREAGFAIANCSDEFGTVATLRNIPADNVVVSPGLAIAAFEAPHYYRLDTDHRPVLATVDLADRVAKGRLSVPTVAEYLDLPRAERMKWFAHGGFRKRMFEANYPDGEGLLSRWVRVEKIPNLRDVGGLPTVDGKVLKRGLLFRSAGWNDNAKTPKDKPESEWTVGKSRLTEKGRKELAALGIRTDLDLRSPRECWGMSASPLGLEVNWVRIPFGHYDVIDTNPTCREAVRKAFALLAEEKSYPLVFHCIGGADRTGCLALMVQALCGVDEETCLKDWELTGCYTARLNLVHEKTIGPFLGLLAKRPGETFERRVRAFLGECGVSEAQMESVRLILRGK